MRVCSGPGAHSLDTTRILQRHLCELPPSPRVPYCLSELPLRTMSEQIEFKGYALTGKPPLPTPPKRAAQLTL